MLGWAVIFAAAFMGAYRVSMWWLIPLAVVAIGVSYVYTGMNRAVADLQSDHPFQGFAFMFVAQLIFAAVLYGIGYFLSTVF